MRLSIGLVFLAGCADPPSKSGDPDVAEPCATFDELAITNPDGLAPVDVMAEVTGAVDQFTAWSAEGGLCVAEVRVEDIPTEEDVGGTYRGALIRIDYAGNTNIERTVFHELCHAADAQAGWFSETKPEWFGADEPHEGFAWACAEGPRSVSLLEGVEAVCDADLGSARQRYLNDEVFGAAAVESEPPTGTVVLSVDRRTIAGLSDDTSGWAYAGGTAVYQEDATRDADGVRHLDLMQVDLATATSRRVDGIEVPDGRDARVFASDAGPLLVVEGDARGWQVDEASGVVVEVAFAVFHDLDEGAVVDGAAWVLGTADAEGTPTFSRVDLATGARTVLAWPEGVSSWLPNPDQDGLAGAARLDAGGRVWLEYAPDTGVWTRAATPAGWIGGERMTLADGRVLATWSDQVGVDVFERAGLAVLDPTSGAWWLPDQPCNEDAIGLSQQLLSVGGEPWLWEYPTGWAGSEVSGGEGQALTRIVIDG
ncbi:MAG: hypothetical protein V4850_20980 [Myxococcota bacterium]